MIGPVRPIDVDTVGLEAPEAGFHRSNHRLSAVAGDQRPGIGAVAARELGREPEIPAPSTKQPAPDRPGPDEPIAIGRVDEIAARLGARGYKLPGAPRAGPH